MVSFVHYSKKNLERKKEKKRKKKKGKIKKGKLKEKLRVIKGNQGGKVGSQGEGEASSQRDGEKEEQLP